MGRLIEADICLNKAWQNFYKQEDEHEKNIDGYDILRDRVFEQSGFECCQQAIVNAPTVEAIPKAEYETRLKADMVAMLTEIQLDIQEVNTAPQFLTDDNVKDFRECVDTIIQQKIDKLRGEEDGNE